MKWYIKNDIIVVLVSIVEGKASKGSVGVTFGNDVAGLVDGDELVALLSVFYNGLFKKLWSHFQFSIFAIAALSHDTMQHQYTPQQRVCEIVQFAAEITHGVTISSSVAGF